MSVLKAYFLVHPLGCVLAFYYMGDLIGTFMFSANLPNWRSRMVTVEKIVAKVAEEATEEATAV